MGQRQFSAFHDLLQPCLILHISELCTAAKSLCPAHHGCVVTVTPTSELSQTRQLGSNCVGAFALINVPLLTSWLNP